MTIICIDLENLLDIVAGLVARGLTFRADVPRLTIDLTGGH